MVKRFDEFLLESLIKASKDFTKILNMIKGESKVAQKLADLLGQDVKTNYNYIKISDDPSKLSFVPDNQATRKLASGTSDEELFAAASNPTTIGRLVKSIFNSNKIDVSDAELENFGNLFRSYATLLSKRSSVMVVSGNEIREWYHQDRYAGRNGRDGTLNKSCMRHEDCQDFFDIYIKNPDVVKMVIKVNEEGRLEARALLWQTDKGPYLDRVYSISPETEKVIEVWAEWNHDNILKFSNLGGQKLKVSLRPHMMYDYYPYMDTFCYYIREGGADQSVPAKLLNYQVDTDSRHMYHLQDTEGNASSMDTVYSEYHGDEINRADAVYSDVVDSWIRDSDSVYSRYHQTAIPDDMSVWSRVCSSHIYSDNAVEVVVGNNGQTDWYPESDDRYPYWVEAITGEAYNEEMRDRLLIEWDGEYYNPDHTTFAKYLTPAGKAAFAKVYGAHLDYCTELDEKVFGFETTEEKVPVGVRAMTRMQYSDALYGPLVDMVKSLDIPQATKNKKLAELAESDKFMRTNSRDYLRRNEVHELHGGFDNLFRKWGKEISREDVERVVMTENFSREVRFALAMRGRLRSLTLSGESAEELVKNAVGETKGGKTPIELLVECVKNPALIWDKAFMDKHVAPEKREFFEAIAVAAVVELTEVKGDPDVRAGIIYAIREMKH
jgi:hypothetical protein